MILESFTAFVELSYSSVVSVYEKCGIESPRTFFVVVVIGLFDKSVRNFDVSGLKQTKWIHCYK